jgi:hypothetical protein
MNISNDPNVWIIYGLVFILGVLVGLFMTAGGRRKWKTRYQDETERRVALERDYEVREREWRERDSLRGAALKGKDRDGDGIPDHKDPVIGKIDKDGDGIDDRVE